MTLNIAIRLVLTATVIGCGGSDGGNGPTSPPPVQTASLSGILLDLENEAPVVGAIVKVGSLSATSAQDGRFLVPNAPIGPVGVSVTASGFDPTVRSATIQAGTNVLDIAIPRVNTMYEAGNGFLIYVPSGVSAVRGVLFQMIGAGVDNRPHIRGDFSDVPGEFLSIAHNYRRRMVTLARAHGLALIGATVDPSLSDGILPALASASNQSGRPELAGAPVLFHAASGGACPSWNFTVRHPDRVIGFIIAKASNCLAGDASVAAAIPGYFIFGELDMTLPAAGSQMTALFEQQRGNGAIWALGVEPRGDHYSVPDLDLLFNWMREVIGLRLPATVTPGTPVQLRPIAATSGWLGDRSFQTVDTRKVMNGLIAEHACYAGDKLGASWLPSEQTARDWQAMVLSRSTTTITPCGP